MTPWPLYSQERNMVPIAQKAGWASWLVWMGAGNLTPTSVWIPNHPTSSKLLYWLHYTGHH